MYVMLPTSRHWRAGVSGRLTAAQTFWLFRPGALTSGLCGLGQVVLRVSREYTQAVCASEACLLKLPARAPVWVREVVMAIDGIDCVSARSLTPLRASQGAWAGIRRLNTRPLAAMLYSDSTILRSRGACTHATRAALCPAVGILATKPAIDRRRMFFAGLLGSSALASTA